MSITPDPAVGYRWYTVGAGRDGGYWWLKLGPVSFALYRWCDGGWRLEPCVANCFSHAFPALTTSNPAPSVGHESTRTFRIYTELDGYWAESDGGICLGPFGTRELAAAAAEAHCAEYHDLLEWRDLPLT